MTEVIVRVSQLSGSPLLDKPIDADAPIAKVKLLVSNVFGMAVSVPRVMLLLNTEILADDAILSSLVVENRLDLSVVLRDRNVDGCGKLDFPWQCTAMPNGVTTFTYEEEVSQAEVISAGTLVMAGYTNRITHTLVLWREHQSYTYTARDLGDNGVTASGTWEYDAVDQDSGWLWLEGAAEGDDTMQERPPLVLRGPEGAWVWFSEDMDRDLKYVIPGSADIKRHVCRVPLHGPPFQ